MKPEVKEPFTRQSVYFREKSNTQSKHRKRGKGWLYLNRPISKLLRCGIYLQPTPCTVDTVPVM